MTTETKTWTMTAAPGAGSGIWHIEVFGNSAQCQAGRPAVRGHIYLRMEHAVSVNGAAERMGMLYDSLIAAGHTPCKRCFKRLIKYREEQNT